MLNRQPRALPGNALGLSHFLAVCPTRGDTLRAPFPNTGRMRTFSARHLREALARETNSYDRLSLVRGLVAVSARFGPEEALQRSLLAARAVASKATFLPSLVWPP